MTRFSFGPYRKPLFGRVSKEELARRYERNLALAEKLIAQRRQAVAEQELHGGQGSQTEPQEPQAGPRVPRTGPQESRTGPPASQPSQTGRPASQTTSPSGRPSPQAVDAFSHKSCQDQVAHHLSEWGRCIRFRRMNRRVTAQMLSEQIGVSLSTLRRVERGDLSVSASTYLMALAQLSLLGEVLKEPQAYLLRRPETDGRLAPNHFPRARIRRWERRTVPF